jgi:hypothetical protein
MATKRHGGDYAVGFGKPPVERRFKPGQSGNPKGRPKGSRNLQTLILEELRQRVKVTENGKTRTISKAQVVAKRLTTDAARGSLRATEILLRLGPGGAEGPMNNTEHGSSLDSEHDQEILTRALQRMAASREEDGRND